MIAVLCEERSSVDFLKTLIPRMSKNAVVKGQSFDGVGELLKRGASAIGALHRIGCSQFIVCADADAARGDLRREEIIQRIFRTCCLDREQLAKSCALIAVQEIEAWILANLSCVSKIITKWRPDDISRSEAISEPKEQLLRMSRKDGHGRELYRPPEHNGKIGSVIDYDKVAKSCPSFRPLVELVCRGKGNILPN